MTQPLDNAPSLNDLATRLSELWDAERCDWTLRFDAPSAYDKRDRGSWCLLLEWTQERGNSHHADWSTHTWEFWAYVADDEGPEAAFVEAVKFCEELLPWRSDDD